MVIANSHCPRCERAFVCEAESAMQAPCACFAVRLSDAARAGMRERYNRCLCAPCLKAIQAELEAPSDEVKPPAPHKR